MSDDLHSAGGVDAACVRQLHLRSVGGIRARVFAHLRLLCMFGVISFQVPT